ncbi:MAG: hypothetical protein ABIQ11_03980 [Saprospiraceae bacterium]
MKWIFSLVAFAFLFTSCDNELVVIDEWKDIPVVWALLNKSDTAHYIRVEKAFLDPTTSALDIARIPDSLYYDDAIVSLKRVSSGQLYQLERVDGDAEGYPREGGIFAETPNYLYKIHSSDINLVIGEEYEFILDRGDGTALVTAKTIILGKPVLRNPPPKSNLSFRTNNQFLFIWNELPNAEIFDLKFRFHYTEKTPETNNQFIPKSVEWTVGRNITDEEFDINGSEFYNALVANIEEDFEAMRRFDSIDIVIWAGGKELNEFIKITQANTGITSTQDIPGYTNLSEGIGIFTSRNVSYYTGFGLVQQTLDSLRNGSITNDLNFQ